MCSDVPLVWVLCVDSDIAVVLVFTATHSYNRQQTSIRGSIIVATHHCYALIHYGGVRMMELIFGPEITKSVCEYLYEQSTATAVKL